MTSYYHGGALIIQGDALRLPLPDALVDLVVTSPPYLWKRKYAIEGTGELGNERDWREYLDNLWAATDEMLRVLKPSGSIFVNLGDTRVAGCEPKWLGIPPKSKLLLPERYRVGCQDRYLSQGVIVRQVQVWDKPNALPEGSVTDRTRDSHEDFVHLTKRPRYYSAVDEVRKPHVPPTTGRNPHGARGEHYRVGNDGLMTNGLGSHPTGIDGHLGFHPLGALPGSVWTVPTETSRLPAWLGVDHYAVMPSEWPRRLVLAWSPHGGTVLDPFGGTGTTAMIARALGRVGVSVDLSHAYSRAARYRVFHSGAQVKAQIRTNGERQGSLL